MFHLDDEQEPDPLRLARLALDRETLWQWLRLHPPTAERRPFLAALPPDATLHDILFSRHGVTFVLRASSFPEVKPDAPLPWLSSLLGEEPHATDA